MKSPQFPTWSPARDTTKGGSILNSLAAATSISPLSYQRRGDELSTARGIGLERAGSAGEETNGLSTSVVVANGTEAVGETDEIEQYPVPIWKRLLDCTLILVSLPITLPLGLFITAWIKVVSPGPVFYRQTRVGRGGRAFSILKFRSMHAGAPTVAHEQHLEQLIKNDTPMVKLDGASDPRIIAGGRCLRAIGLDELPQLINVIRGEMSLVGPRPSTPNEHALYTAEQQSRATVLPGLTGYWQVSGKNKLTFQQMIHLDLQYIEKMSPGLDLAIVVATIPAMLLQFMESRTVGPRIEPPADPAPEAGSADQPATRPC